MLGKDMIDVIIHNEPGFVNIYLFWLIWASPYRIILYHPILSLRIQVHENSEIGNVVIN